MKRMLWLTPAMILLAVSLLPAQAAPAPKQSVPKKQGEVAAQPTPQQPTVKDLRRMEKNIRRSMKELQQGQATAIKMAVDAQTEQQRVAAQKQANAFKAEIEKLQAEQKQEERQ